MQFGKTLALTQIKSVTEQGRVLTIDTKLFIRARQPRVSLTFKPVWMYIFEKRVCLIWVRFRLSSVFVQNGKKKCIFMMLKGGRRAMLFIVVNLSFYFNLQKEKIYLS